MERPVIAIFDRGYPSLELIDFLEANGISYLFRLSCNDYKAERGKMKSQDEIVHLEHTSARLSKIRKKHPERYEWMKEKREIAFLSANRNGEICIAQEKTSWTGT